MPYTGPMNNSINPDISGHRILVTRPATQAAELAQLLEQKGVIALQLPALEIRPLPDAEIDRHKVISLDQYDAVIAVSAHAADIALEWIDRYWPQLPSHLQWFAVGNATATTLGLRVDQVQVPIDGADTEALLALPALEQLSGKRILILKGRGGRRLLEEQLAQRGCQVDCLDLYCRAMPTYSNAQIAALFADGFPDSILATSVDSLENICEILRDYRHQMELTWLITASDRITKIAKTKGFNRTHTARGASSQAVIAALNVIA